MIQDQDLPGACLQTGLGHRDNDQGMGRRGKVGCLGKRHIGFDDDSLSLFDEAGDASQGLQGLPGGGGRLAGNHGEIDFLRRSEICRIACQADGDACRGRLQELPS